MRVVLWQVAVLVIVASVAQLTFSTIGRPGLLLELVAIVLTFVIAGSIAMRKSAPTIHPFSIDAFNSRLWIFWASLLALVGVAVALLGVYLFTPMFAWFALSLLYMGHANRQVSRLVDAVTETLAEDEHVLADDACRWQPDGGSAFLVVVVTSRRVIYADMANRAVRVRSIEFTAIREVSYAPSRFGSTGRLELHTDDLDLHLKNVGSLNLVEIVTTLDAQGVAIQGANQVRDAREHLERWLRQARAVSEISMASTKKRELAIALSFLGSLVALALVGIFLLDPLLNGATGEFIFGGYLVLCLAFGAVSGSPLPILSMAVTWMVWIVPIVASDSPASIRLVLVGGIAGSSLIALGSEIRFRRRVLGAAAA